MSLVKYSHDDQKTMPYAKVYSIHSNYKNLSPDVTFADIYAWLRKKEKELGGYKGKFFDMDDWGYISFYHHVLKRAKVNYTDLIHEINSWGSAFKREPKAESKVSKGWISHKEFCCEKFGWSEEEFESKIISLKDEQGDQDG